MLCRSVTSLCSCRTIPVFSTDRRIGCGLGSLTSCWYSPSPFWELGSSMPSKFPIHKLPGQTLREFLESGWKLPFIATMIVGVSSELYRRMREHLESRNRELQMNLEREATQRERQERELQQAREIQ